MTASLSSALNAVFQMLFDPSIVQLTSRGGFMHVSHGGPYCMHINSGPVGVLFWLLSSNTFVYCHVSVWGISDKILIAVTSSPFICTKITDKALCLALQLDSRKNNMIKRDKHEDR